MVIAAAVPKIMLTTTAWNNNGNQFLLQNFSGQTMIPAELLRKKRDGSELSADEIRWFIQGLSNGSVTAPQAAAFLMAACTRGLSAAEVAALTLSMADSGDKYDLHDVHKPKVDKHSTGGVGDKISLPLLPVVAACGVAVPMISGRGLGHTGGTVDKLESVGISMDISNDRAVELLQNFGGFFAKQTEFIAPADKVLYHLRDVTGTVESTGLITASILSKKFCEDLNALVMDIKVGKGAFMETFDEARVLAESMIAVARQAGLRMRILFTGMNQPLGHAIGNWLEFEESLESLRGKAPTDIRELTERLGAAMVFCGGLAPDINTARTAVQTAWNNGSAERLFCDLIQAQAGNIQTAAQQFTAIPRKAIIASRDGCIQRIEARAMGLAGIMLGAGRKKTDDILDYGAGIILYKKCGQEVRKGEEIGYVQGCNPAFFDEAIQQIQQAFEISTASFTEEPLILDEWDSAL